MMSTWNQSGRRSLRVLWIVVAIVAIVCVVVGIIVFHLRGQSAPEEEVLPVPTGVPAPDGESGEGNLPGAMAGNTQRSWPSPYFDDSVHTQPGQWSVDPFLQRPTWTPIEHDGDMISPSSLVDGGFDQCDSENLLGGETHQQYVNARYMVLNESAGPTETVRGIPQGYAHSPQGAVVAAMNTAMFTPSGDEIGNESYQQLWHTSVSATYNRELLKEDNPELWPLGRHRTTPAPVAFKIMTCSEHAMVVRVAISFGRLDDYGIENEYAVVQIPLMWTGQDWQPDFTGANDSASVVGQTDSLNGFIEVKYQ